ncbi:MAG: hypothetical protein ABGY21_13040, partial [Pseudomonadota bacterium]
FDDFVGAESTTACITVTRLLSENDRLSLKYMVIDFRKVRSATLVNTDRALHSILYKKMLPTSADLLISRLYDQENPVTPTLLERLDRTEDITQQTIEMSNKKGNFFNEQELLIYLNLPKHIKIFDDAFDWQAPSIDKALPTA